MEIKKLLSKPNNNSVFVISSYQRLYTWSKRDINLLFDSIENEIFIGSGIYAKKNKNSYEIIDGQQRLITIMLIIGKYKKRKFKFNVNKHTNDVLNKIMHGVELKDIDNDTIKEDFYIQRIQKTQQYINEKKKKIFENKKSNIFSDADLFSKINFPFFEIKSNESIPLVFSRINRSGEQVGIASIYKSLLIYSHAAAKNQINSFWYDSYNIYEKIKSLYISQPIFDDIFVQAYNAMQNDSSHWISKSKKKFKDSEVSDKFPKVLEEYIKWASNYLIKNVDKSSKSLKNIKELLSLCMYTLNGKVVPYTLPLIFLASKLEFESKKNSEIFNIFIALSVYNNIRVASDEIPKKVFVDGLKEIFNEMRKNKGNPEMILQKIISEVYKLSNLWTGNFKDDYIKKIKFSFTDKKIDFDLNYSMTSKVTKFAFLIKSIIFIIANMRRSVELKENGIDTSDWSESWLADIFKSYSYRKLLSLKSMSIEHLRNANEPSIKSIEVVDEKFNSNILKNKSFEEKINIIRMLKPKERSNIYNYDTFFHRIYWGNK